MIGTEMWDAYDEKRQPLGTLLKRGEPIPKGAYHLCVNVLVRHVEGEILFMHRSPEKALYPNYYEFGSGGSALAGESSRGAALRELKEETGLTPQTLRFIDQTISHRHQCFFDYYEAIVTGDKQIDYQKGETDAHVWLPVADIPSFIEKESLFRHQKEILYRLIKEEQEKHPKR